METTDKNLELFQKTIQDNKPELHDAELLTESIMKAIKAQPRQQKITFLLLIRAISGIAAIYLVGLFLSQFTIQEISANNAKQAILYFSNTATINECLENTNPDTQNFMEIYNCHMQKRALLKSRYQVLNQINSNN